MNKALLLLVVSLALLAACSQPGPGGERFDQAVEALRDGDPKTARETFAQLDSLEADSPYGSYGKALYFEKERQFIEAANAYEKCLTKFPEFVPAILGSARLAMQMNRPVRARAAAEKAYKLEKHNPAIMAVLCDALTASGEPGKARRGLMEAIERTPDDPQLMLADARFQLHAGEFDKALHIITDKVAGTADAGILKEIGDVYARLGMADEAAGWYAKALHEDRNDYYLKADIADAYIEIGYYYDARRLIDQLADYRSASHRYYLAFKNWYETQGDRYAAFTIYLDAYMHFTNSPTVLMTLAHLRYDIKQTAVASTHYEQAFLWAESNQYAEEDIVEMHLDRAEQMFDHGQVVAASAPIKEILDNPLNEYPIIRVVSLFYAKFADKEKAVDILKRLDSFSEGNPARMTQTGDVYRRVDSLDRAQSWYDWTLKVDRVNTGAILGKLTIWQALEVYDTAVRFLDSLDRRMTMYRPVAESKYDLLMASGKPEQALAFARELIISAPHSITYCRLAVQAATKLGQTDEIIQLCREYLDNNPEDVDAHSLMAEQYWAVGETDKATEEAARAIAIDSVAIKAHLINARILLAEGKVDSVKAIYSWLLTKNEYVDEALSGLVEITLEQGGDYHQAMNLANHALQVDNQNPINLVRLGRVQYASGRYDIAKSTFEHGLKTFPDNAEVHYYAGVNYLKLKDNKKAREQLNRALKLGLRDELKQEANRLLTAL